MELGILKPILTSVALPPLSLILLAMFGLILAAWKRRGGLMLAALALALLWLVSCHGTAVWLARNALPQFPPLTATAMKAANAQAIVVLGGGLRPEAPEYGEAQLNQHSAARLRYGITLAKQSGLPVAFTGGIGWGTGGVLPLSEAEAAARAALTDYGVPLRWVESKSRDTGENARLMAPMLQRDGVTRIALVTDASHMPRAAAAFERVGLIVSPAPTGYLLPGRIKLLEWLPSASGLESSCGVLREWLAMRVAN